MADLDVGLDYAPDMAGARTQARPDRHRLARGDGSRLPFRDHAFDGLSRLRFFHLFPPGDREGFAREFERVVSAVQPDLRGTRRPPADEPELAGSRSRGSGAEGVSAGAAPISAGHDASFRQAGGAGEGMAGAGRRRAPRRGR